MEKVVGNKVGNILIEVSRVDGGLCSTRSSDHDHIIISGSSVSKQPFGEDRNKVETLSKRERNLTRISYITIGLMALSALTTVYSTFVYGESNYLGGLACPALMVFGMYLSDKRERILAEKSKILLKHNVLNFEIFLPKENKSPVENGIEYFM